MTTVTSVVCVWKVLVTIGGETHSGTLGFFRMHLEQAGVAALVLDGHRLDGELAVRQRGTQPHSSLVRWLNHGVTVLCVGGHICGVTVCWSVPPYDLLHLLRQTIGAGEGHLLTTHCCLVAVSLDWC